MKEELAKRLANLTDDMLEAWLVMLWMTIPLHDQEREELKDGIVHHMLEHTKYPAPFTLLALRAFLRMIQSEDITNDVVVQIVVAAFEDHISFEEMCDTIKNADEIEE